MARLLSEYNFKISYKPDALKNVAEVFLNTGKKSERYVKENMKDTR